MFPHTNAIVPVLLWKSKASRPHHVGSAVMLHLDGRTCLLTAAHVADLHHEGKLCIPGPGGATEFAGGIGFNLLPPGISRNIDPIDIAFLVPTEDQHSVLPDEYKPVEPKCIDLSGKLEEGDFCLIAGYPLSRAWVKYKNNEIIGSRLHFVGVAVAQSQYAAHGCNSDVNILIEYHLNKAIYPEGDRANAPSPRGMSGGGVFRIRRDKNGRPDSSAAELIGVMHTFREKQNMFVATKLIEVFRLISKAIPSVKY